MSVQDNKKTLPKGQPTIKEMKKMCYRPPMPHFFLWTEPDAFEPEENIQAHYNLIRNDEIEYYPPGDYMR